MSPKHLAHGAGGDAVGHTVDVDPLLLVDLTHGLILLSFRGGLAAAAAAAPGETEHAFERVAFRSTLPLFSVC